MVRFFLWLLLAWPTPALIAGALGWKGVWGSGSALGDYLVPIPVAGGAFHAMTFAVVTVFLLSQKRLPAFLAGSARGILLAATVVGAWLLYDFERGRILQNPVGLFLLTDSLIAQLFVGAFGGRWPASGREWIGALAAAALLPAAAIASIKAQDPRTGQQFVFAGSRPGEARGDDAYFIHARIPVTDPAFRSAAATYIEQFYPHFNVNTEDFAFHFFTDREAAQRQDAGKASLTYCVYQDGTPPAWHPGKGDCFDHESVTERAGKLYAAQDPRLPQEERSKLARAAACKGVRQPATDNAVARYCGRKAP